MRSIPLFILRSALASIGLVTLGLEASVADPDGNLNIIHFDESALMKVMPAAFLDSTGFEFSGDSFAIEGLDVNRAIFPVFPLYEKRSFGRPRRVDGVVIPPRFVGLREARGGGGIMIGGCPRIGQVEEACAQIRDLGYNPVFMNNHVYGSRGGFSYRRETTFGITLEPNFSLARRSGLHIVEQHGFQLNLANGINQFFRHAGDLLSGEKAEETLLEIIQYLPLLQYHLHQNAKKEGHPKVDVASLEEALANETDFGFTDPTENNAIKNSHLKIPVPFGGGLPHPIDLADFGRDVRSFRSQLDRDPVLAKEIEWKESVSEVVGQIPVLNSEKANLFLQELCDYLASAIDMPPEIWPRCRIMASLQPNAFAFPGGDIFMTAGLLGVLSELDSVVYVLGHEIGHVLARHTSRRLPLMDVTFGAFNVFGLAGQIFSLSAGGGAIGAVSLSSWFPKTLAASALSDLGTSLVGTGFLAGLMAHSRSAEWEADRLGHQLALSAGASQRGITRGWQDFGNWIDTYIGRPEGLRERLFSTHPDDTARLRGIDRRYGRYQYLHTDFLGEDGVHLNQVPLEMVEVHARIYKVLKPYVEAYGQRLLAEKNSRVERRLYEHTRLSLFSAGGHCVTYALGGYR